MIDRENIHQKSDQIVDVSTWDYHDEYEVFPTGAREKSLRVCPQMNDFDFCIPNHKYLFKESMWSVKNPEEPRHPEQYWSEIMAFKIGRLMGVNIPPAFVAWNSNTGEPGALIEWYTGYDSGVTERVVQGGDYMQRMIPNYDRDKGTQHNLNSLITMSKVFAKYDLKQDWKEYWGICLLFDAVIGNSDRHQDNWEIVWDGKEIRFSPYFDNGTSLGHELFTKKFNKMMNDPNMLNAYINRGKHHMKWNLGEPNRLPLIEGVVRYCTKFPEVIPLLLKKLQWDINDLSKILGELTTFDIKSPLTNKRTDFILKLTSTRKNLLTERIENII